MRIAVYHELHKGGARRGTNEFAKQLKLKNNIVDLYTIDKTVKENSFYTNIYFFKFKKKIWRGNNWKIRLYKDTIELIKLWKLNKKIAKIINKKNYDLIYVTASQFIETPFILNYLLVPKFYYLNDPYYRMIYEPLLFNPKRKDFFRTFYEKLNRFIRKNIDKFNVKKIDYVLAASDFTGKQFKKIYGKKSYTVYYGVDTGFFRQKSKIKDIDILFIGSENLLDGYPLFKDIIKGLVTKVTVKVILFEKEWLNDVQMRDIYSRSKILVATSYNEPLGLVPLEAMACGAIVIAVNEAGYKETIVNNINGFLLNRNSSLFIKKIEWLLKNPQIMNSMSNNAIRTVRKKWEWSKRGESLQQVLSALLMQNNQKAH